MSLFSTSGFCEVNMYLKDSARKKNGIQQIKCDTQENVTPEQS